MWIIGHSALAYLVIKLTFIGLKKKLLPRLLIFIFVFANILDSLHFGPLRWISHNLIGALIYSGIWIIILLKLNIAQRNEVISSYISCLCAFSLTVKSRARLEYHTSNSPASSGSKYSPPHSAAARIISSLSGFPKPTI